MKHGSTFLLLACVIMCSALSSCLMHTNAKLRAMSETYEAYKVPRRAESIYEKDGVYYAAAWRVKLRREQDWMDDARYRVVEWEETPSFHKVDKELIGKDDLPPKAIEEATMKVDGEWVKLPELCRKVPPLSPEEKERNSLDWDPLLTQKKVHCSAFLTYPASVISLLAVDMPVSLAFYTIVVPIGGIYFLFDPGAFK